MYVCKYVCMYVYTGPLVYLYKYVCMYVCVYVCVCRSGCFIFCSPDCKQFGVDMAEREKSDSSQVALAHIHAYIHT